MQSKELKCHLKSSATKNKSQRQPKNGRIVIACLHISVLAGKMKCKYFSFQYK